MECHTNTSRDRTCLCRLPVMAALLAAASLVACGGGSIETTAASDREALVAFYNSADGDNWTDKSEWLSDRPTGQWYGVTTDVNGSVTHLDLNNNELSGEIPAELGSLSNLLSLYLLDNQLSGAIPVEMGSLSKLQTLWIHGNSTLSGPLPKSLTGLTSLLYLNLDGTELCAPMDDGFQMWLQGVENKDGVVNCASSEP